MKNISEEASRNIEGRISLSELCRELSISVATGRNWIRLGKLVPEYADGKRAYFSTKYVQEFKSAIQSNSNKTLKSRRNKKYVSGNALYNSYVSEDSANIGVVQELLDIIEEYGIELNDDLLQIIIADCAKQLLRQRFHQTDSSNRTIDGKATEKYERLISDLIVDEDIAKGFKESYPRIFELSYAYEEREDILGLLYISCRNLGSRKASGSYYTPTKVVRQLVGKLQNSKNNKKSIIDPCCGTGNFLLQLPDLFSIENIYGNDLDNISVKITRINMALKYKTQDIKLLYKNITVGNFLTNDSNIKYDYIIGNPPWGYEFSEGECGFLRENYKSAVGKNIESYDVFVEKSICKLEMDGVVSFVLPEAILNVKSHMPVRKVMAECCSIEYLSYLGNVFHKVQCPSIIMQLRLTGRRMTTVGMQVQDGDKCYTIETDRDVKIENFSFKTNDIEYNIIQKIKNRLDMAYLKDNAIFAMGIVTGNNEDYITHDKNEHNEIILKGSDICKYRAKATNNYIVYEPEKFQQVAPTEYYRAPEKLLYRFIGNQLVFAYDDKQTLSLNSCNILIPHIEGLDMKYILAVLNSSVAQFFYEKEFGSVKVLRWHIEQIPIPRVSRTKQKEIINLVEKLIAGEIDEAEIEEICAEIDGKIAELFEMCR